ncbi:MAG: cell division protein FtsN [Candidatus Malihini olakiniferum]
MAQRDYVRCGRSRAQLKKITSRRIFSLYSFYKLMIIIFFSMLVTFAGGFYLIVNNEPAESPVLLHSINGNVLPPKPEERWRYIKELENRQLDIPPLAASNSSGAIKSLVQLTQEQRKLLEQMQADMRRTPKQLSELTYNDQTPAPRYQVTINVPKTVVTPPAMTKPPVITRAPVATSLTQADISKKEILKPVETTKQPEAFKLEKKQRWIVQCGSFKTLEPAESARAQLAFSGIESRIASSGGWNHITLGPYKNRVTADKTLSHLKDVGTANCISLVSGG